jgi:hypothetical protein
MKTDCEDVSRSFHMRIAAFSQVSNVAVKQLVAGTSASLVLAVSSSK